METQSIRVTGVVPATAARVYAAYLDSAEHSAMTGAPATVDPRVGGRHTAWGDFIEGEILELGDGRIVQTWRASNFPAGAGHSHLEVLVEPEGQNARVTFVHTELPDGMGPSFETGWQEHYLKPMRVYFSTPATSARTTQVPTKPAATSARTRKPAAAKRAKAAPKKRARKASTRAAKMTAKRAPKKPARRFPKKAKRTPMKTTRHSPKKAKRTPMKTTRHSPKKAKRAPMKTTRRSQKQAKRAPMKVARRFPKKARRATR